VTKPPIIIVFGHRFKTGSQRRFLLVSESADESRLVIERRSDTEETLRRYRQTLRSVRMVGGMGQKIPYAIVDRIDGTVTEI
jgi:hypothetical protein